MTGKKPQQAHLPSKEQVEEFIRTSEGPVGKREIAKAFGIKGADRIYLKQMLKELISGGALEKGHRRSVTPAGSLPSVLVVEIVRLDKHGETIAKPVNWDEEGPVPVIYVSHTQNSRTKAPGIGDRLLVKVSRQPDGHYDARIIRHLQESTGPVFGIVNRTGNNRRV